MQAHQFGEVQHTSVANDNPYQKCRRCGKVMFVNGDDYFNMVCPMGENERQQLRKKLEA